MLTESAVFMPDFFVVLIAFKIESVRIMFRKNRSTHTVQVGLSRKWRLCFGRDSLGHRVGDMTMEVSECSEYNIVFEIIC